MTERPGDRGAALRRWWPALAAAAGLLLVAVLHDDFGVAWDDGVQAEYGERVLADFGSGLETESASELRNLRHYGPLFELPPMLLVDPGERGSCDLRHAWLGLLAVLLVPLLAGHGRLLGPCGAGALAVLALVTLPRFVGHAFTNSKDLPFAVTVAALLLVLARWAARGASPRTALLAGLALGLALAARPGSAPLLAPWLLFAAALGLLAPRRGGREAPPGGRRALRAAGACAAAVGIGWLLMVLPWPWAHGAPLARPLEAMGEAASFSHAIPVLFDGRLHESTDLPLRYLPVLLGSTVPPLHLLLAGVGAFALALAGLRRPREAGARAGLVVLAWVFAPLLGHLLLRPPIYDGLRHYLFVMPGLALLAGAGTAALAGFAAARARRSKLARGLVLAAGAAALLAPLPSMVRLHPYQTAWFSPLVGGLPGADGRHDTDYWLLSAREAVDWIAAQGGGGEGPVRVLLGVNESGRGTAACEAPERVEVYTLDQYQRLESEGRAPFMDYVIAPTRFDLDERLVPGAPVLHVVGREGVAFAVVKGPPAR